MACIRKLNLGAVSLVPGRVKDDIRVLTEVRDQVELLLDNEFFENAPFECVGVIMRYGTKTSLIPEYQPVAHEELPVAIELSMDQLRSAVRSKNDELARIFKSTLLETLLSIAERYNLPRDRLWAEKKKVDCRN
jgi:hypothetical protein